MGGKSTKEKERELSPVTRIRGRNETGNSNQSTLSRNGPTSSKWPRQTPPPGDAWGQKPRSRPQSEEFVNRLREEDPKSNSYNLLDIHTGLTMTEIGTVSDSRYSPQTGGGRQRDRGTAGSNEPPKPKVKNADPFAHFKNVTELRDIKEAKENRPPPESRPPPWRKPATPPPQAYLKKNSRGSPTKKVSVPAPAAKHTTSTTKHKKKKEPKRAASVDAPAEKERSASDISTLDMDPSPEPFKKIEDDPKFSKSLNVPISKAKNETDKHHQRSKSSSPPSSRKKKEKGARKAPVANRRHRELQSSNSFTNISTVKSATQSVDSASSVKSNFEQRTRVEKFKDKMDSLATAGIASHHPHLNNQFIDQKIVGLQSYEKAKRDCESDDWEREIKGIEMLVSISRDKPEVSKQVSLYGRPGRVFHATSIFNYSNE